MVSEKWEYLKVHRVIGGKQLLPVNFATVRRKKTEKITAKDGKTDKELVRKESGEQRKQGHKLSDK